MDWHEKQINQILRHAGDHRNNVTSGIRDLSCRICYPAHETTNEQFRNFWGWYQGITTAERFSGNAERTFENLMKRNTENILEGKETFMVNALIYSIQYQNNSGLTITEIRARIINMIVISEKFTRDMDEAAESYKTKSSGEENSSKEESPKENSPERSTSTALKGRTEKLEKSKDQDVEKWDTSTEKLLDEDEIERMKLDLEIRKIRRLERTKSVEEIESIISGELNSVKSEDLKRDVEYDIIKGKDQKEETQKQINETKYRWIKERIGDEIDQEIITGRMIFNERMVQKVNKLKEKESLTEEEFKNLERWKAIERDYEWINKYTYGTVNNKIYEQIDEYTIGSIYDEILKKEKEKEELSEKSKSEQDKKLFQERCNQKKEKYDKIRDKIGDEIDEELIKARERLHENITQRIRYFEEKKTLTVREAQELEDLKRPEKLDEEELLTEEYIINDIYEGLTEKEKEDKIDVKGKSKETKNSSKLELEKGEEHTVDTVDELGRFLGETLKEIEEEEEEKKFGLDDEEVRTWAENIEVEDEEIIDNIIIEEEKVINTPEISSSSESSSDSDKESEIIEIVKKPEFDFTRIYLEDLNLENLFKENSENSKMALDHGVKCRTFGGKSDESLEEWIDEFERVADFNGWAPDGIDRAKAAGVYLRGEALQVYKRISGTAADNLRWDHGNDNIKLKVALETEFMTPVLYLVYDGS